MGCKQSTTKSQVAQVETKPATQAQPAAQPAMPQCNFCKKVIPDKLYNAHTVMCDEREVVCWNSWCREIIKQGTLSLHMEQCAKLQRALCSKCGENVLATELQAHRDGCQLIACTHCHEKVIARIVTYCPMNMLGKIEISSGPFATEMLRAKYLNKDPDSPLATLHHNIAKMQLLLRWGKARTFMEESIFWLIHKEMDLKKEGFAIFKAHDQFADINQVQAPKRSRSVLQTPQVAASTTNHYFPTSSNTPITIDHVKRMIKDFTNHVLLPYNAAWRVFSDTITHLNKLPTVQRVIPFVGARVVNGRLGQGSKTVVVGDLHGQLADLLHILKEGGFPDETTNYIFNGDFVDRGQYGVELLLILFSLMLACPKNVALNRGNHECDYMNEEYGFDVEVSTKYDRNIFRLIQRCFCALPLATLVGTNVFVVHGGIPRRRDVLINDIIRIQRFRQIPMPEHSQPEEDEIFQDLLWSDPRDVLGWKESDRGAGVEFGSDVTEQFLRNNNLELVIRSHQEFDKGYEEHHNKKLVTVFSASNYDGPDTNYGAFIVLVGDSSELSFHTYQVYDDDFDYFQDTNSVMDLQTPQSTLRGSFFSASGMGQRLSRKRIRDEVVRVLRDRIFQRRHRLLAYCSKLDRSQKGSLWKIEWVEAMRNVLNMDLPWYFLRHYLAEQDIETSRIGYIKFLMKFKNNLTDVWMKDWEDNMCLSLKNFTKARPQTLSKFTKDAINYNEFCSILRAIDSTLSDASLFQLFLLSYRDSVGTIDGHKFIEVINQERSRSCNPLKWDLDAIEQLQNMIIQGRLQIQGLFKVTHSQKFLTRERFIAGMNQLSRGAKANKQLTPQQVEAFFNHLSRGHEEFSFDWFMHEFSIVNRNVAIRKSSCADLLGERDLPITPVASCQYQFPMSPK